jgi:hemerythrin-like domain-containing protein
MPVKLGTKPEHGFDQPLGLLSDCHRRIENFLEMLIRVLEQSNQGASALSDEQRRALEAALRYFQVAAPRHTQDEEQSLFPRMRASDNAAASRAFERLDALEHDHREADVAHAAVDRIGRQWLEAGVLAAPCAQEIGQLLHKLRDLYARHIAVEDSELFPLAARLLDQQQLEQLGSEMAQRRGLQYPQQSETKHGDAPAR